MGRPTDIRVHQVTSRLETIRYRTPMKFGGRVVEDATLLHVSAEVEGENGVRATGEGSMPLGNVWAWPSQQVDNAQTLSAMQAFAEECVKRATLYVGRGHALEIATDLAEDHESIAADIQGALRLPEPLPGLAQRVAASPIDAALHDGYGKVHQQNAYNVLGSDYISRDLAHWLGGDFAGEYLDQYTLRQPKSTMPLYHLVGALDPLTSADIANPLQDHLPETLGEWILADGLTHLKIKLNGDDLQWDVERVVAIDAVAAETQSQRGCQTWYYSLDFNERCANVDYVLDFLGQLQDRAPAGFQRVQYIEQPTHRDLHAFPENRMHAAAKIKPVVIDESLLDLESLMLSRELGYSGVALKACKGHTEALLMGAAAQKFQLFLCVQDLTCPGASFLHSASLACRIPTVAAIEGNGRQYCPAGNAKWSERYPSMFEIRNGSVETRVLTGDGLGF